MTISVVPLSGALGAAWTDAKGQERTSVSLGSLSRGQPTDRRDSNQRSLRCVEPRLAVPPFRGRRRLIGILAKDAV